MAITGGRRKNASFRVNTLVLNRSFTVCRQCCLWWSALSLSLFLVCKMGTIFPLQHGCEPQRKNIHQACTEPGTPGCPKLVVVVSQTVVPTHLPIMPSSDCHLPPEHSLAPCYIWETAWSPAHLSSLLSYFSLNEGVLTNPIFFFLTYISIISSANVTSCLLKNTGWLSELSYLIDACYYVY